MTGIADQLGDVKPHVLGAGELLAEKFGLTSMSGFRSSNSRDQSGHPSGLAIDIPASRDVGDKVAAYVTGNAAALGVKYVIWQQAIWTRDQPTWTPMATRTGAGDQNHLRHVHVSFTEAAPDANLFARLAGAAGAAWGTVTGTAGDVVASLNPVAGWQDGALAVGVKVAVVLAGLGLLVLGAARIVQPAAAGAIDNTMEALT